MIIAVACYKSGKKARNDMGFKNCRSGPGKQLWSQTDAECMESFLSSNTKSRVTDAMQPYSFPLQLVWQFVFGLSHGETTW